MSRNKKQSTKAVKSQTGKTTASEVEQVKDSKQDAKVPLKDVVDTPQEKQSTAKSDAKTAAETADKTIDKTAAKAADEVVVKDNAEKPKTDTPVTKASPVEAAKTEKKTEEKAKTVEKEAGKQATPVLNGDKAAEPAKQQSTTASPETTTPAAKKSGGAGVFLALLLGVAGTGLGVYSFNELRTLKAAQSTNDYTAKLAAIESQLQELGKAGSGEQQMSELLSQVKALKTAEAGISERITLVEQAQGGTAKNITQTVEQQLAAMDTKVKAVQEQIAGVKLGQQGLVKNISEVTAGSEAVTDSGVAKQEVGYLLRMADYKLASERDVTGAAGLLQMAADRLLAANQDQSNALIDAIRAKVIQLQGVTMTDENGLLIQLGQVARDIPLLVVKSDQSAVAAEATDEKSSDNALDKITSVIASGIKYTPKDPNQIDISAETVLIEKRLMQADVKTAEFAIRSHNKTLLSESFRSIRDTLDRNFADNETAQAIKVALAAIEQSELTVVLPSLSGLVKQFEQAQ